jgi:hypothetical protein
MHLAWELIKNKRYYFQILNGFSAQVEKTAVGKRTYLADRK